MKPKLQLHGNFELAIAMQFSETSALPSHGKKLRPGYKACRKNLQIEKFARIFSVRNFLQFSEVAALPEQDVLCTEISTCNGNTISTGNCMFLGQFEIKTQVSFQKQDEICEGNFFMFLKTNEGYLSQIALETCNYLLITLCMNLLL